MSGATNSRDEARDGWKSDGKQLELAVTSNRVARAVDILPGEEFGIGPTRILGRLPNVTLGTDLDPAWTRSIAIVPSGRQPKPSIRIVLAWDAMISKR